MEVANEEFQDVMEFLMDVGSKRSSSHSWVRTQGQKEAIVKGFASLDNGADLAYKLSEIRRSQIHDYLYTKFGSLKSVFIRLTTLVLTSTALTVFVVDRSFVTTRATAATELTFACLTYCLWAPWFWRYPLH